METKEECAHVLAPSGIANVGTVKINGTAIRIYTDKASGALIAHEVIDQPEIRSDWSKFLTV
jgi:hypothetical protein